VPKYQPHELEKCHPLLNPLNIDYVSDKLTKYRQGIIDKYGSSKVPTPCMSVISKSSPTHSNRFDSASKQDFDAKVKDFLKPENNQVKINFDDELSQVVQPEPMQHNQHF